MFRALVPLLGVLAACATHLPPTLWPEEVLIYATEDGWEANLRHYPGEGPPVLLVHGMGANHYNWDYREEVSLAHHLQERGWDVWVPELRGDPGSRAPSRRALRSFTFDDHARYDLPAAVDAVLAITGEEQLYWVGHSMGGMLLYTALAQHPEKIAAGVAVSSPVEFDALLGIHKTLRSFRWALGGRGRIQAAGPARLTAGLGRANPLYRRLANRDNLDFPVANGLARHALIDLPRPMIHQVTSWLRSGELLTVEGEPWLAPVDVPLLVLGGAMDRVVPEPNVAAACDLYPDCTYLRMGEGEEGFSTDYGHVDPIVGRTAREEVYPRITDFLEAHRERDALTGLPPR